MQRITAPLIEAAAKGHADVCTALITAGADVNAIDSVSAVNVLSLAVNSC